MADDHTRERAVLTVSDAAKRSESVFSPLVISNEAGVSEVELGHRQTLLVGQESVVEHVDAGQTGVAVARVGALFAGVARLALLLQAARALARVRRRPAPVPLDHEGPADPPAPARSVQVWACCTHTYTPKNLSCHAKTTDRDCVRPPVPTSCFLPHAGPHLATAHFRSHGHRTRYHPVSPPRRHSLHSGDL